MTLALRKDKLGVDAGKVNPELERQRLLRGYVQDYLKAKQKVAALEEDAKLLRGRIDELAGLDEAHPKLEFAGLATVTKVWKRGSRKIDRETLINYLMTKLGATGDQANKVADAATVEGESSVYIEVRPVKKG